MSRDYERCVLFGGQEGRKNRIEARRVKEKNRTERKGKEKEEVAVAVAELRYWPLSWKG